MVWYRFLTDNRYYTNTDVENKGRNFKKLNFIVGNYFALKI